jgi:hypothetical protein
MKGSRGPNYRRRKEVRKGEGRGEVIEVRGRERRGLRRGEKTDYYRSQRRGGEGEWKHDIEVSITVVISTDFISFHSL